MSCLGEPTSSRCPGSVSQWLSETTQVDTSIPMILCRIADLISMARAVVTMTTEECSTIGIDVRSSPRFAVLNYRDDLSAAIAACPRLAGTSDVTQLGALTHDLMNRIGRLIAEGRECAVSTYIVLGALPLDSVSQTAHARRAGVWGEVTNRGWAVPAGERAELETSPATGSLQLAGCVKGSSESLLKAVAITQLAREAVVVIEPWGRGSALDELIAVMAARGEILSKLEREIRARRASITGRGAEAISAVDQHALALLRTDGFVSGLELAAIDTLSPTGVTLTAGISHDHRSVEVRVISRNSEVVQQAISARTAPQ